MKSITIICAIVLSVLYAGEQFARTDQAGQVKIDFEIKGFSQKWVKVRGVHANVKAVVDSVWLDQDGKGQLSAKNPMKQGYYEVISDDDVSFPFILDEDQELSLMTNTSDFIREMVVHGSLENELLYRSLQYDIHLQERFEAEVSVLQNNGSLQPDNPVIDQLRGKYFSERAVFLNKLYRENPGTIFTKMEVAKLEPQHINSIMADQSLDQNKKFELILSSFWNYVDFSDERLLNTPVIFDKLWQYFNQFVPNQTEIKIKALDVLMSKVITYPAYYEFFASWIADDYIPPFTADMDPDALYVHLVDNYLTREKAIWADSVKIFAWNFRAKGQRSSLVGMKGENIAAETPDGNVVSLDEVKSGFVALFFYHYDCDHCVETAPKLVEEYKRLKELGCEVFAVAMDTPKEEWKKFIESNNMNWINVSDEKSKSIYNNYNIRATPEIILLDSDRTIIGKHLGVEDLEPMIQAYMNGAIQIGNNNTGNN